MATKVPAPASIPVLVLAPASVSFLRVLFASTLGGLRNVAELSKVR